jgi:RHS repeat-associated protein
LLLAGTYIGFIGERYDAGAGLQFLNARYDDPKLGMFIPPDLFEVMEPGVGTNRYSYSFNDPVNKLDPSGNATLHLENDNGLDLEDEHKSGENGTLGGPNRLAGVVEGVEDPSNLVFATTDKANAVRKALAEANTDSSLVYGIKAVG